MKKKIRRILSVLIILIGLVILVYPSLSQYLFEKNSSRAVSSYDDTLSRMMAEQKQELLSEAYKYNTDFAQNVLVNGMQHKLSNYDEILNVNGAGMMGYICIPKLGKTIPVYHGIKESVLQVGIGHMENTSLPVGGESAHAVLSGHTGLPTASLFTDIDKLKIGDIFYTKILDEKFYYTVDQILVVLPDETDSLVLREGKDNITLVTCTPYGVNSHRLLIRGVRTDYDEELEKKLENLDTLSWWEKLPTQYKHLIYGICIIVLFLILWKLFLMLKKKLKERKEENK